MVQHTHTSITHTHSPTQYSRLLLSRSDTQVADPSGLAVDYTKGLLYVSDFSRGEVTVVDLSGRAPLRVIGTKGTGPGQLKGPCGVALDCLGNVLVADSGNKRVSVFRAGDGVFVAQFATPMTPRFVLVDRTGHVVVSGDFASGVHSW